MCSGSLKLILILKVNAAFYILIEIFTESFSGMSGAYQLFISPHEKYSNQHLQHFLGHTPAFILCGQQNVVLSAFLFLWFYQHFKCFIKQSTCPFLPTVLQFESTVSLIITAITITILLCLSISEIHFNNLLTSLARTLLGSSWSIWWISEGFSSC